MTANPPQLIEAFLYRSPSPIRLHQPSPACYHIVYLPDTRELLLWNGSGLLDSSIETDTALLHTKLSFLPNHIRTLETQTNGMDILLPFEVLGYARMELDDEAVSECEDAMKRIDRFYREPDWVLFNRLVMAFFDLLIIVYAQCEPSMKAANYSVSEKARNARKVTAYLENAFSESITLESLERELHLSKQYMSKIFRETTGMTIFDYLYRRRIHEAKKRFQAFPCSSITDICFQVGFHSVSHFSRLFKTHVGVSPEKYRKSLPSSAMHPEESKQRQIGDR